MKRHVALAAAVVLCLIPAAAHAASYTDAVLSDTPVDLWLLDAPNDGNPFSSATGSGHRGLYQGAVTTGVATPLATGSALGLAGGGAGVQSVASLGDFSIDGLVYWDHSTPGGLPNGVAYGAMFDSTSPNGTAFSFGGLTDPNDGSDRFAVSPTLDTGQFGSDMVESPSDMRGAWHHVAVTRDSRADGATVALYVDGRNVGEKNYTYIGERDYAPGNGPNGPVNSWGRNIDGSFPLSGSIDDVALYTTTLSASQVAAHASAAAGEASDAAAAGRSLNAGETLADGFTPNASDPLTVAVTAGEPGTVRIQAGSAPAQYDVIGTAVAITATAVDPATGHAPIRIVFKVDPSKFTAADFGTVDVVRDSTALRDCSSGALSTTDAEHACVTRTIADDGTGVLTVQSWHASNWAVGRKAAAPPVTPSSLCLLTKQYVQGSPNYTALPARLRGAIDAKLTALCNSLDAITARLGPVQKSILVLGYRLAVNALAQSGWLTPAQAAELSGLAGRL